MELEFKIRALMMDPNTGTPIVVLKDVSSDTMLPIWISGSSAEAIAIAVEHVVPPRPLTHDLMRNLIELVGMQVDRIVITELRDQTFYAVIELRDQQGATLVLDARPSDSIALALRVDCPIFIEEEVIRASHTSHPGEEESTSPAEEEWPEIVGDVDLPM